MADLNRFVKAQENSYEQALSEIKGGRKTTHWIWYIFPQLRGLGTSDMAEYYGIENLQEAKEYLAHPILGKRLCEISTALAELSELDPCKVLGYPDDLKVHSCMTLFRIADPDEKIFKIVLDKYYDGKLDDLTLDLLKGAKEK